MNANVLYRGKEPLTKEWVYGGAYVGDNCWIISTDESGKFVHTLVEKDSLGHYSGFSDKDNQKIFSGDFFIDENDGIISVVSFRDGAFCLVDYGIKGALMEYGFDETAGGFGECACNPFPNFYIEQMKIFGNISEHPEVLKGIWPCTE